MAVVLYGNWEGPWRRHTLLCLWDCGRIDRVSIFGVQCPIHIVSTCEAHIQSAAMREVLVIVIDALFTP